MSVAASQALDPDYVAQIRARLDGVYVRIEDAGGSSKDVVIVAVTKGFDANACRASLALGLVDLGENYADELCTKAVALNQHMDDVAPRWHFLGSIQRNKLARLAPHVFLYEGVDRLEEGEALAKRTGSCSVLIEVASASSTTRGGVAPDEVPGLVSGLQDLGVDVQGLMTIGTHGDPDATRQAFRTARSLVDRLELSVCSMGMTDDLEIAVEEGSSMVRVGRALFGPRPAINISRGGH